MATLTTLQVFEDIAARMPAAKLVHPLPSAVGRDIVICSFDIIRAYSKMIKPTRFAWQPSPTDPILVFPWVEIWILQVLSKMGPVGTGIGGNLGPSSTAALGLMYRLAQGKPELGTGPSVEAVPFDAAAAAMPRNHIVEFAGDLIELEGLPLPSGHELAQLRARMLRRLVDGLATTYGASVRVRLLFSTGGDDKILKKVWKAQHRAAAGYSIFRGWSLPNVVLAFGITARGLDDVTAEASRFDWALQGGVATLPRDNLAALSVDTNIISPRQPQAHQRFGDLLDFARNEFALSTFPRLVLAKTILGEARRQMHDGQHGSAAYDDELETVRQGITRPVHVALAVSAWPRRPLNYLDGLNVPALRTATDGDYLMRSDWIDYQLTHRQRILVLTQDGGMAMGWWQLGRPVLLMDPLGAATSSALLKFPTTSAALMSMFHAVAAGLAVNPLSVVARYGEPATLLHPGAWLQPPSPVPSPPASPPHPGRCRTCCQIM